MEKYLRTAMVVLLAVAIIVSCTIVGTRLTDAASYTHTIEVLDKNRTTVLGLSAASAAASAAVSALPSDICTPLAEELSEFTTWFLMILSVIYLEKYLLTIFGAVACYLLIPVGCGALLINCFYPKRILQNIGSKLTILAAAILLVIPTSIWVSDQINAIYSQSIELTVESASAISDDLISEAAEDNKSTSVIDEAKNVLDTVSGSIGGVVEQFKNLVNRFIEATAVMLVTNCFIPVLVILFFGWLIKVLFNVQVYIPVYDMRPKFRQGQHRTNSLSLTTQDSQLQ